MTKTRFFTNQDGNTLLEKLRGVFWLCALLRYLFEVAPNLFTDHRQSVKRLASRF